MFALEPNPGMAAHRPTAQVVDCTSIADHLLLTADLLELLSGEETEALRYRHAATALRGRQAQPAPTFLADDVASIPGIEPDIRTLSLEVMATGDSTFQSHLRSQIPAQVLAMLRLPGLGAKRLHTVWKEMGITDSMRLYHAATENRLLHQKGFGPKTQEKVLQSLAHARANGNNFLHTDLLPIAAQLASALRATLGKTARFAFTGDFRRGMPVCNAIEVLAHPDHYKAILLLLVQTPTYEIMTASADMLRGRLRDTEVPFLFHFKGINFFLELFRHTGSAAHVALIPVNERRIYGSEVEIYEEAGLPYLPAELREGKEEVKLALANRLPRLVESTDIKGLLHVHSTYSDGSDSLESLAVHCRALGMQYMGITDHGPLHQGRCLSSATLAAQHREIERLNAQMAPFRILKGVEAEILPDGSLGMTNLDLASCDFVIASLHTDESLSRADATMRLIRAIRNPFTTILGHPTGSMGDNPGQPVDMDAVIDACAAHDVALELNCHPCRLDRDWHWIRAAAAQGVRVAINPNAHHAAALSAYETGVTLAKKGLLSAPLTLNTASIPEIEDWLLRRRVHRIQ